MHIKSQPMEQGECALFIINFLWEMPTTAEMSSLVIETVK